MFEVSNLDVPNPGYYYIRLRTTFFIINKIIIRYHILRQQVIRQDFFNQNHDDNSQDADKEV